MPAAEGRARLQRRARTSAVATGFRLAFAVVPRLPEPLVVLATALGADLAWWRRGAGVRRLEANLSAVEGDPRALRQLSRAGMHSYARYWCDAFRLHTWTPQQLRARTRVDGAEALVAALRQGRGAIAFLGHSGSWDQVGAWGAAEWGGFAPVLTVVEKLEPEEVFETFLAFRARLGITAVALDPSGAGRGAAGSFTALVRGLRSGCFVPLLADRDLSGAGVPVTLLGRPARAAAGPAALALATGAPLFPVTTHYERPARGPWTAVAVVHPAVAPPSSDPGAPRGRAARQEQIAAMTQACVDVLSDGVRAHPADWHMLQPIFADSSGDEVPG